MSNLIDEIDEAAADVQQRELEATIASRHLRECKTELRKARTRLYQLAHELKTKQSAYPLFERIQVTATNGNGTPDEHQRGPTEFPGSSPTDVPAKSARKSTTKRTGGSGGKKDYATLGNR